MQVSDSDSEKLKIFAWAALLVLFVLGTDAV